MTFGQRLEAAIPYTASLPHRDVQMLCMCMSVKQGAGKDTPVTCQLYLDVV